MRLIDADALLYTKQLEPMGNGQYEDTWIIHKDDIDNAPTIKPQTDLISRADAIEALRGLFDMRKSRAKVIVECFGELLNALPSAEAVPQSDQYKKGFEDAKRAFLVEYARECENMRKRNAQLEVIGNALKAKPAEAEWIPISERLPDVGEIVIASWSDLWSDAIVFARRYCEDDWEWAYEQGSDYWESARDYDRESNPEAWMPLPKPYREESGVEE